MSIFSKPYKNHKISKGKYKIKFENATCEVTANSYYCKGGINELDKAKIKKVQKELMENNK